MIYIFYIRAVLIIIVKNFEKMNQHDCSGCGACQGVGSFFGGNSNKVTEVHAGCSGCGACQGVGSFFGGKDNNVEKKQCGAWGDGCRENHKVHYCKVCKKLDSNHRAYNCPKKSH